jgi:hypothetical protein
MLMTFNGCRHEKEGLHNYSFDLDLVFAKPMVFWRFI